MVEDLTGRVYSRLTVLGPANVVSKWCCRCECGLYTIVHRGSLLRGRTKSCGCFEAEARQARKFKIKPGDRFGMLAVLAVDPRHSTPLKWRCVCDCGAETSVVSHSLLSGSTASCGCLRKTAASGAYRATHEAWSKAKDRCFNPRSAAYVDYGARGITMCAEWRNSFAAFLRDMGFRPDGLSLDRRDNDGPYSPENCRWATNSEQALNRRQRPIVTHCAKGHPLTGDNVRRSGRRRLCRVCNNEYHRLRQRRLYGLHRNTAQP